MLKANDHKPSARGAATRLNLVRATIDALELPAKARAYYSDIRVAGLQLVRESGDGARR